MSRGAVTLGVCWCAIATLASAQPPFGPPVERGTPREAAPIDLTGAWIAVVTEDWRWRMQLPPTGDYASIPLNDQGRQAADRFDPARDDGTCRAYGAANLLRMPTRLRIDWDDDATLRIETDHGMQTRRLYFDAPQHGGEPSRQGVSSARWSAGALEAVTTNLLPGYLRRNGVPYSAAAVVTEFFDRHAAYGDEWLTVTTIVDDPTYLRQEFITSSSFKRLTDANEWHPVACEER